MKRKEFRWGQRTLQHLLAFCGICLLSGCESVPVAPSTDCRCSFDGVEYVIKKDPKGLVYGVRGKKEFLQKVTKETK